MIYRSGDTYIFDTGQSPKGFKGVVAVCKEGTDPSKVTESVRPVDDLKKFEAVEKTALTPEWRAAFGLPEPKPPKKKPPLAEKKCKPGAASKPAEEEEECSQATWKRDYVNSIKELWGDPAVGFIILPFTFLPILVLTGLACVNLLNDYLLEPLLGMNKEKC